MTTKQTIAEKALELLGIHTQFNKATPAMLQDAVSALEFMIASWAGDGLNLPYNFDSSAIKSLNSDSGLPLYAVRAVYYNLAVTLVPFYRIVASPEIKMEAVNLHAMLIKKNSTPPTLQKNCFQHSGAGYKVGEIGSGAWSPLTQEQIGLVIDNGQEIDI